MPLLGLSGFALAAAGAMYLSAVALSRTDLPGCDAASGCDAVLQSPWSTSLGLPVAFLGFASYVLVLFNGSRWVRREPGLSSHLGGFCVWASLVGAVWFTAVQVFMIRHVCPWCCAVHASATIGAVILIAARHRVPKPQDARAFSALAAPALGLAAVAGIAAGSALQRPAAQAVAAPVAEAAAAPVATPDGHLVMDGGRLRIDPADFPSLGPDDAKQTALLLSDFTCGHCRAFLPVVAGYASNADNSLRVLLVPAARSADGQEIQNTMALLHRAAHPAWERLVAGLADGSVQPTARAVARVAIEALGPAKWADAWKLHGPAIQRAAAAAPDIFGAVKSASGHSTLPQLWLADRVLAGAELDPARLAAFLKDAAARPLTPAVAAATSRPPALIVRRPVVDAGTVAPGHPVSAAFTLENAGATPLHVGWLDAEAGCHVREAPTRPIPPGGSATVRLLIDTPTAGPAFERTVTLHPPDGQPARTLTVRGRILPPAPAPAGAGS